MMFKVLINDTNDIKMNDDQSLNQLVLCVRKTMKSEKKS